MLKEIIKKEVDEILERTFYVNFYKIEELAERYDFEKVATCRKPEGETGHSFSFDTLHD